MEHCASAARSNPPFFKELSLFLFVSLSKDFYFFLIPFWKKKDWKQFIMLAAPQPLWNTRGSHQIKTEITFHSSCLEATKAPVLNLIEYRAVSLAYCIHCNVKEEDSLSRHASVLFDGMYRIQGSLPSLNTLVIFTLYLNKITWTLGKKNIFYIFLYIPIGICTICSYTGDVT